jgi:hypothetical protein
VAESSLSQGLPDFEAEVGHFLGYTRTSANWSAAEHTEIEQIIHRGYRQFLFPPPLNGKVHEWTFLKPTTTLSTTASDYDYDLPDNFGTLLSNFTFAVDTGWMSVVSVGEAKIREMRQMGSQSGRPQFCAVRPSSTAPTTTGQRFEVIFYPTPDATYVLTYRYMIQAESMYDSTRPYPYGGTAHCDTILESCLALAEQRNDDEMGIHTKKFYERLGASIEYDKRQSPDYYGVNTDKSGSRAKFPRSRIDSVTFGGTQY